MAQRPKKTSVLALRLRKIGGGFDPLSTPQRPTFSLSSNTWIPPADVTDCEEHMVIRIEIAGIDPGELLVLQDGRYLVIQGHRSRHEEEGEVCLHLMEIQYGSFERAFELPDYLDLDSIKACYKDGFLHVRIRKTTEPPKQARVLQVKLQEQL